MRFVVGEQPLETEEQRETAPPLDRGQLVACLDLAQRRVKRPPPCRPRSKGFFEGLALVYELLSCENLCARNRGRIGKRGRSTHSLKGGVWCASRSSTLGGGSGSLE